MSGTQTIEVEVPRKAVSPPRKLPFVVALVVLGALLALGLTEFGDH